MIFGAEIALPRGRDRGANHRSAPRGRLNHERAADRLGTLTHPAKTEPRWRGARVKALAVVLDPDKDLVVAVDDLDLNLLGAGVAFDIGQRLLDDSVDGVLQFVIEGAARRRRQANG